METIELIKIQDMINDLSKRIDTLNSSKIVQPEAYSSVEIKELATALAKAQADFGIALFNKVGHFKNNYADFTMVVQASRPALTKNGLSVVQIVADTDDGKWLITKLIHISGEWMQSKIRILPVRNDVQAIASAVTYMKRMCYVTLIGVVVGDEDDDGEAAMESSRELQEKAVALNAKYVPKNEPYEIITAEQLEEINLELAEYPDIAEMILEGLKIQYLGDLPKSKYFPALKRIREIKQLRNGNK